jgi:transposase
MAARSPQHDGAEWFTTPAQVNHRRYEALRAFFVDGLSYQQAADRFGYTRWAMINLVREWRVGKLELFAPPRKPGPPPGVAPAKERVRGRVIQLRRQGLSTYEISARLAAEQTPLNRTSVGEILAEEGFGRLLRGPQPDQSSSPATAGRDTRLPRVKVIDVGAWPRRLDTTRAGLLLVLPGPRPGWPGPQGRLPRHPRHPRHLLAAESAGAQAHRTRRVSHLDDPLADPAAGLLAGLGTLPKKSALTSYSYRLWHDHQRALLAALDQQLISAGLASGEQAIFDLDFHAVLHWGADPVLDKHYVPKRSQRARSVLTFFAQDSGTHNLVYANADLSKATQAREVIAFCDHWKAVSGADPHLLVMDQRLTNQQVLGELDARGVKFLTLRMRSPSLLRYINGLTPADDTTITLDRSGKHRRPGVHESAAVRLTSYPGTLRQLIVTGLGHDAPTVIITNHHDLTTKAIIGRYARRMTIEQRLAEIIRAFCADALSSTVNLNVDLDVMLAVLAQALLAAPRTRLPGYHAATCDTLQRRFLETPGTIINHGDTITVRLERRAYSPVLRKANLPAQTTIPWWGNRTLRYEFA